MAFKPANLVPWLADWPDVKAAIWQYKIPNNDTLADVMAPGYFNDAPRKLAPRSLIVVGKDDDDGDGITEAKILLVLRRNRSDRPETHSETQSL